MWAREKSLIWGIRWPTQRSMLHSLPTKREADRGVCVPLSTPRKAERAEMRRRAILLLMAMAAALVVVGGVAYAAAVTCDGEGDRDDDTGECRGTKRADSIEGTDGPEVIKALAGNDNVSGHAGNDEIYGDEGNDSVDGFGGNDTIYGGPDGDGSAQGAD